LSLAKFIAPPLHDFAASYCRNPAPAQAGAAAPASNYRVIKKSPLTTRRVLWNASKSVKVSRDRTVVLTIFWRVCCKQFFAGAHGGVDAYQATAK
jgi:hypothetical protein